MKVRRWNVLFLFGSLSACSNLFYQPDQVIYDPPENYKIQKQDLMFNSADGTRLNAWYFPPEPAVPCKGTVIQFHGNSENMTSHYTALVWLTRQGYSLLTFDYRGYGKSEGEPTQSHLNADALLALDLAAQKQREGGCKKLIVYGQSLGGVIAMRALADWSARDQVNLIVMDSTFMSYKTVARQVLANHWMTWLLSPLGWLLVSDRYASDEVIQHFTNPLVVIHDELDPVVPFSNGQAIFNAYPGPKVFWSFKEGTHIGFFDSLEYQAHRKKFLDYLE